MFHNKLAKGLGIICSVFLLHSQSSAQSAVAAPDTLRLDIQQAEKTFLDNNLQLLAQHYNIQSSRALIEQARKWDNPVLNTDQNVYTNGQFLQHGKDINGNPQGQVYVQVQQLIKTAGKRGKQISLARTNVDIAEWEFQNTMRNLRSQLLRDFYTVAQLQGNAALYTENLARLRTLIAAREQELKAGNIARKEYLRIEALIVSLQQDIANNDKSLSDAQNELKTILGLMGNVFVQPQIPDTTETNVQPMSIVGLTDTARAYNPEYRQELTKIAYNQTNLSLQKATAIPDVTLGPEFDQASNFTPNYYGLAISLPIPLWDRNQGNIRSARAQLKQQEATAKQAGQKLENDVLSAYQKLVYTVNTNKDIASGFYKEYYQLQKNIVESYNKRLISLIEFLDFYNDYQQVRQKELQQTLNVRLAKEELNFVVGKDVIQ
jgi:cobalt-zinc-cadmium efflux system outer membrane protein